jgi:hypothetical protein
MIRLFICSLLLIAAIDAAAGIVSFNTEADAFFKKYVSNGLVAYRSVKKNILETEGLYKKIGEAELKGMSDLEKKAFYINAYNIIVIYWVAKNYPLKSPLDYIGFFDVVKHKVAGEEMTLNELETEKLLLVFKDPRIHFALSCAARGCPPLAAFAYLPSSLDKQLDERTTQALNNPNWIKVYPAQMRVELSKIFEWYRKDFLGTGKTAIEWINQFRKEKIPASYAVGFYEYDWGLNEK